MPRLKNILYLSLRLLVSVLLLFLLFKLNNIDLKTLAGQIKGARPFFLLLGFLALPFTHILGFFRWRMLIQAAGINIPFRKLASSFCGGIFFSIFLPSTIGGDLVRTADLAAQTQKTRQVVATVFLDRLSGYIGLVLVVLPAIILGGSLIADKVVYISAAAITMLLALILVILFNKSIYDKINFFLSLPGSGRIKEMIRDMHREVHVFRGHKKMILVNLTLSFIIQMIFPLGVYFTGISLGLDINPFYFFIFIPIISAITLLPVSLGGLGLREGLYVVYFAKAGVVKQLALAMSLLSFSFIVFTGAIGGIIYVLTVHHRRLQPDQSPSV